MIATSRAAQHPQPFCQLRMPAAVHPVYRKTRTENNLSWSLALSRLRTDCHWLLCGNPYQPDYVRQLKSLADRRVIFTGPSTGRILEFAEECRGIVFAGEIGGIHPALVEAMALEMQSLSLTSAQTARPREIAAFHFIQRKETWRASWNN